MDIFDLSAARQSLFRRIRGFAPSGYPEFTFFVSEIKWCCRIVLLRLVEIIDQRLPDKCNQDHTIELLPLVMLMAFSGAM